MTYPQEWVQWCPMRKTTGSYLFIVPPFPPLESSHWQLPRLKAFETLYLMAFKMLRFLGYRPSCTQVGHTPMFCLSPGSLIVSWIYPVVN